MSINTDEVNFLVYRYLEESGFHHSAYVFGYESSVINTGIDSTLVPRGALMSLIQKSVLFAEAEVFSLLAENEIDAKFEKAIGSMSLLECTMSDAAKIKAFEKMREDVSQDCSQNSMTSTPANSTITTNVSSLSTPGLTTKSFDTAANNYDGISSLANNTGSFCSSQNCSTIASSSTSVDTTAVLVDTISSHFHNGNKKTDSNLIKLNSKPSEKISGSNNDLSSNAQLQRDREFRAHQSQQQLGSLIPSLRTIYRTSTLINDHKSLNSTPQSFSTSSANPVLYHQYYQPGSQPHHSSTNQNSTETSSSFTSLANGISSVFTPTLLHQQVKSSVVDNCNDFSSSTSSILKNSGVSQLQQNQARYNGNNGNFSNNQVGKKTIAATIVASTAASNDVGKTLLSTSHSNSGSVFDNTRFY